MINNKILPCKTNILGLPNACTPGMVTLHHTKVNPTPKIFKTCYKFNRSNLTLPRQIPYYHQLNNSASYT